MTPEATTTEGRAHIRALPIPKTRTFPGAGSLNLIGTNILKAQKRGLPVLDTRYAAHRNIATICGGGPSLEDTYDKIIKGNVVAVNGSHDWLVAHGVIPNVCVLLCPVEYLLDAFAFTPRHDVHYFVASLCHDNTFDRLKGFDVTLWHASFPAPIAIDPLLPKGALQIAGGGFVSLRAINLMYVLGFRRFHLHALDSSHRRLDSGAINHHVYAQARDDEGSKEPEIIDGYPTFLALHAQVSDFFRTVDSFEMPGHDPIEFTLHGDGLLQHAWKLHTGSPVYRTQPPPLTAAA